MPTSTNANLGGKITLGDSNPGGTQITAAAADLSGDHGTVSAQIANIAILSDSYTNSATQLADNMKTAVNALIGALTNKGTVAAS